VWFLRCEERKDPGVKKIRNAFVLFAAEIRIGKDRWLPFCEKSKICLDKDIAKSRCSDRMSTCKRKDEIGYAFL
jgi:hypothetical protein